MPKRKIDNETAFDEEVKEESSKEKIKPSEKKHSEEKVVKEDDYFFPHERVTVKATSLQEAIKKLKQNE